MRYWINTVSRDHVQGGAGGFTQVDHGKDTRLKRMSKGDGIIFYSPRGERGAGEPLQRFTTTGPVRPPMKVQPPEGQQQAQAPLGHRL